MNALRNKVQLIGNLGMNPEIKTLESGKKLAKFSIATNESYKNAQGERIEDTQWHNLVAWGKTADIIEKYLQKTLQLSTNDKLLNYIIPIGGSGKWTKRTDEEGRKRNTQPYIRWDALCVLINENLS